MIPPSILLLLPPLARLTNQSNHEVCVPLALALHTLDVYAGQWTPSSNMGD